MTTDVYADVTDKMIAALEAAAASKGTVPWHQPWTASGVGMPRSMSTGKLYRGINPFLLSFEAQVKGYTSQWWGTYDQIAERAGMVKQINSKGRTYWTSPEGDDSPRGVRKGEKSTMVVKWISFMVDVKGADGQAKRDSNGNVVKRSMFVPRYYNVFNADQAEHLPAKYHPSPLVADEPQIDADEAAEALVADYLANGPKLNFGGDRACYSPSGDWIQMPERQAFDSTAEYYSTLFHEVGHSTGHKSRLKRDGIVENHYFGDALYSKEELIAEMTAAMLAAISGIDQSSTFNNSVAYIRNWIGVLKGDTKLVVQAAGAAQRAADLIQGITFADEAPEPVAAAVA
jgi:antirestriction protein ArdC